MGERWSVRMHGQVIVQRTSAETRAVARPIPMHPESRMAVKLAKAGWSRVKRASQVSERQRGEGAQVAKAHGVSQGPVPEWGRPAL